MGQRQTQQRGSRVRKVLALGAWLVAAGAAAVVGLDPEGLVRS